MPKINVNIYGVSITQILFIFMESVFNKPLYHWVYSDFTKTWYLKANGRKNKCKTSYGQKMAEKELSKQRQLMK